MRFFIFLLLGIGLWCQGSHAQSVISERGQAAVRVYNENYARARESAIAIAKKDILTRTMTQFLQPEDVEQLYPVLENRLLNELDSFVESTRVMEEFADEKVQEFFVVMEARLYRSRIIGGLQQLAIPLQNDLTPAIPIRLRFDKSEWFVKAGQEKLLKEMLQRRLAPYRVFLSEEKENEDAPVFELRFSKTAQQLLNEDFSSATIGIQLLLQNQGQTLNEVYAQRLISNRNVGYLIAVLLDQLMLDWAPLIRDLRQLQRKDDQQLRLEVLNAPSAEMEYDLFKLVKNQIGWVQPTLHMLTPYSVVYQGKPEQQHSEIFESLHEFQEPRFRSRELGREQSTIYWRLDWKKSLQSLKKASENPSDWPETKPAIDWTLPENPQGTFYLPLESSVYAELSNRGSSHWFFLKLPEEVEASWQVSWDVLGNTKLQPKIFLLDSKRNRIGQQLMMKKETITINYGNLIENRKLFVRISDEIGYIKSSVGGYQSFRYVLRVEKK
jgi:hypothetical protein